MWCSLVANEVNLFVCLSAHLFPKFPTVNINYLYNNNFKWCKEDKTHISKIRLKWLCKTCKLVLKKGQKGMFEVCWRYPSLLKMQPIAVSRMKTAMAMWNKTCLHRTPSLCFLRKRQDAVLYSGHYFRKQVRHAERNYLGQVVSLFPSTPFKTRPESKMFLRVEELNYKEWNLNEGKIWINNPVVIFCAEFWFSYAFHCLVCS